MTMPSMTMAAAQAPSTASAQVGAPVRIELGWGASLGDIGAFENAMTRAVQRVEGPPMPEVSESVRALMRPFDTVNGQAASIAADARAAQAANTELTPSQLLMMTAKSQMFMFHCQLTSNAANRTSDGLQQLFRQQS
jgi:hypothetical protein